MILYPIVLIIGGAVGSAIFSNGTISSTQPSSAVIATASVATADATVQLTPAVHWGVDTYDPVHLVPASKIGLFYNDGGARANASEAQTFGAANTKYTLSTVNLDNSDCASLSLSGDLLTVTFSSSDCYNQAASDWRKDDELLVLSTEVDCDGVSGNDFCHLIAQGFSFNDNARTAYASFIVGDAKSLLESGNFQWGQYTPSSDAEKRDLIGVTTPAVASINQSYPFSFKLDPTTANSPWGAAYNIGGSSSGFYCIACGVSGNVLVAGAAAFMLFAGGLTKASVDVDASMQAALQVGINISAASASSNKVVGSVSLVNFRFSVVSLVSTIELDLKASGSLIKDVNLLAGIKFDMPNAAAHLDFLNSSKTTYVGFDPIITPVWNMTNPISGLVSIYTPITISTTLSVLTASLADAITYQPGLVASIGSNSSSCAGAYVSATLLGAVYNSLNRATPLLIGSPSSIKADYCL